MRIKIDHQKNIFPIISTLLVLVLFAFVSSCGSKRPTGFELMRQIADDDELTKKEIYLTSTMPIDSIDPDKLIFDVFTIEIDDYPKEVRLKTRVFDSLGHFVTNMANPYLKDTTRNYWVKVTEKVGKIIKRDPVPIDSFKVREFGANDSIPYNIVLSIDYSGSMKGVMSAIYEGTELFINLKTPYDHIGINSFNKEFSEKVPLSKDTNVILNMYRDKREEGFGLFSAVRDAMNLSMDSFEDTPIDVPRVMVVFTDGDDNYSSTKLETIIKRAKKEKIHIFNVAFGYAKTDQLRLISENTGGKFYQAYTKEELIAIFRDIYMSLRYFYLVSYTPPEFWGFHMSELAIVVDERSDTLFAISHTQAADSSSMSDDVPKDTLMLSENSSTISAVDEFNATANPDEVIDMDTVDYSALHFAGVNFTRGDSLFAYGMYDTSGLFDADGDWFKTFERPVLFDFDSTVVQEVSFLHLDEVADKMLTLPTLYIEVQGHTDNVGTPEYNQELSDGRAHAVVQGLINRGVEPRRLRSRGFGMSQPRSTNETEAGRTENRRTVFEILRK